MAVCEPRVSSILRFVEGTLDRAACDELATHLESCVGCRQAVAEQAAVKKALGELPLASVSADFAARVRARVAPPRWMDFANWRVWTLRLVPVAALLAWLAVLPAQGDSSESTQSLAGVIDSWTAAGVGVSPSTTTATTHMQLLLNPDADPNALLAAALEGVSQ